MEKIKALVEVNDYKFESTGILTKGVMHLEDKDTDFYFDINNMILTRKNKELELVIDYKKELFISRIPELRQEINSKIQVLVLTNINKTINIIYQIE